MLRLRWTLDIRSSGGDMKNPLPSWLTVALSAAAPALAMVFKILPVGPAGPILVALWTGFATAFHLNVDPAK